MRPGHSIPQPPSSEAGGTRAFAQPTPLPAFLLFVGRRRLDQCALIDIVGKGSAEFKLMATFGLRKGRPVGCPEHCMCGMTLAG